MRRSRSIGYARLGKALREQIALEGRDKVLLLQWLQQLTSENDPPKPDPKSGKPNVSKYHLHTTTTSLVYCPWFLRFEVFMPCRFITC